MPSLEQLEAFKNSFLNVGNEMRVLNSEGLRPENFPLPPTEPKEIALPKELGGTDTIQESEALDRMADSPEPETGLFGEDLDFSDLLGSAPNDLPRPSEDSIADGLGLDEMPDMGDFERPEASAGDIPSQEDFGDFNPPEAEDGAAVPDSSGDSFELPDMDLGFSGDDFALPEAEAKPSGADSSGESLNVSGEDISLSEIEEELSPGESSTPESAGASVPEDFFEGFSLGDDASSGGNAAAQASQEDTQFSGIDDFSLKGLDEIFGDKSASKAGKSNGKVTADSALPKVGKEVEEINLTESEYAQLEQTIASYPLNLRLVCEEVIAEQVVAPDLMSALVKLLIRGGGPKEAAALAGKILGQTIPIPKSFEKKTGEELEAEQASLPYIFVHQFLPLFRVFLFFVAVAASLGYLVFQFIFMPIRAESIYKKGYQRIAAGEYERANERFNEAFTIHRNKNWFYRYAEAFRQERRFIYAEKKYEELLRFYPQDKKGVLAYADMETNELRNYAEADRILRHHLLDYAVNDKEGLVALGDNNLAWGDIEPARYENARQAYARLLELYGWENDFIVERMMLYFIRTDNLAQVLPLQGYFDNPKRNIRPASLAELGGYLLDKRIEEIRGVPDEHIAKIEGIRGILLRAAKAAPDQPEPHYHLARYYGRYGNPLDERYTLETAIRAFDTVQEETPRRTGFRIDAERRYAQILIHGREFVAAERELIKGIGVYEDALERRLLARSPELGRLYADLGDLEYFVKTGDMETVLDFYRRSELHGWAPVEIQYRIGAAHYQLRQWGPALERFFNASAEIPLNRRLLYALGNVSYLRGNYFAAQGYYSRLLDLLEADRARFPSLSPNERADHMVLAERLMVARNNMGVTMEVLADRTGRVAYRSGAMGLYTESARAWDAMTRDPVTMVRPGAGEIANPGINLAFINSHNTLYPVPGFEPQLYLRIDKDVLEPSFWEELVPLRYQLSNQR